MATTLGTMAGPAPTSPPEAQGANTFSNLKGLFKQKYATCKHCGKQFTPKAPMGDKQKQAVAIQASKGPSI